MCQSLTHRKKVNINNLDSCHQTASPARENSAPPADNSRPENLTDEEWQLVQMARQEKDRHHKPPPLQAPTSHKVIFSKIH